MAEEVRSIKDLRAAYYANTHAIDKRCQKHPTVLMIRTKNPCTQNTFEFCPECGQEIINEREQKQKHKSVILKAMQSLSVSLSYLLKSLKKQSEATKSTQSKTQKQ